MLCRYCGMDTRNPQVCEWCHKQLAAGTYSPTPTGVAPRDLTQPMSQAPGAMDLTQPMGHTPGAMDLTQPIPQGMDLTQPVPQHQFRTTLTGEAVPIAPAPVSTVHPPQGYPQGYGQPGHAQPAYAPPPLQHPGMPTHAVVRPPSVLPRTYAGLPSQAIGTDLARGTAGTYMPSLGERWEKCLAISLPILLLSVWVVHLNPSWLPWIVLADLFFIAMAMGGTASIGSYDDAYLDVGAALMVSFFFGPTVGLVVYLIVGAIKQEFNGAIIALLLSHILVRFIVLLAFPMKASAFTVMPALLMFNVLGIMSICMTFGGWILSSFFRPLNE
jgi:hypothetical protein